MSAELLRRAAALMRVQHGPEHPRHEMWEAMAEWLDFTAEGWERNPQPGHERHALAVARAYLGELS